jgi:hypothetical protein
MFCCKVKCFLTVLFVRKAILLLEFLNNFVMNLNSFPMYVNIAHLFSCFSMSLCVLLVIGVF